MCTEMGIGGSNISKSERTYFMDDTNVAINIQNKNFLSINLKRDATYMSERFRTPEKFLK